MKFIASLLLLTFACSTFAGPKRNRVPDSRPSPISLGYESEVDAAFEALKLVFSESKKHEYGGCIFIDKKTNLYHFTQPETSGLQDKVRVACKVLKHHQVLAFYHSHPRGSKSGFSGGDVDVAKELNMPSYIGCAETGEFRQYLTGRDKVHRLGRGSRQKKMSMGTLLGKPF